jgi:hypothetical protein
VTDSATVRVIWRFTGFFQPVDDPPVFDVVKAGRGVPVRFSLGGLQGFGIVTPGHPGRSRSRAIRPRRTRSRRRCRRWSACCSTTRRGDRYTFVWKTSGARADTCRRLVFELDDGTTHTANFRFTR